MRRIPSRAANRLISRVTGLKLHDYGCTLKAYDREVIEHLELFGELHRFIPALALVAGAKVVEIPVNHRARERGTSKYGISRLPRVLLDLLTVKFLVGYRQKPMQFLGRTRHLRVPAPRLSPRSSHSNPLCGAEELISLGCSSRSPWQACSLSRSDCSESCSRGSISRMRPTAPT